MYFLNEFLYDKCNLCFHYKALSSKEMFRIDSVLSSEVESSTRNRNWAEICTYETAIWQRALTDIAAIDAERPTLGKALSALAPAPTFTAAPAMTPQLQRVSLPKVMGDEKPACLTTHLSATVSGSDVSWTQRVEKLHRGRSRLVTECAECWPRMQLSSGVEAALKVTFAAGRRQTNWQVFAQRNEADDVTDSVPVYLWK